MVDRKRNHTRLPTFLQSELTCSSLQSEGAEAQHDHPKARSTGCGQSPKNGGPKDEGRKGMFSGWLCSKFICVGIYRWEECKLRFPERWLTWSSSVTDSSVMAPGLRFSSSDPNACGLPWRMWHLSKVRGGPPF